MMSLAGALWFAVQDDLFTNGLCSNSSSPSISISNTIQGKHPSARLKKDLFVSGHSPTSAEPNILAALACYAQGSLCSKTTDLLGLDQTAAGEAVKTVTQLLADMSPDFITFPNSYNDRMGAAQAFKNLSGVPHVVGVLGYLHVKVSPPLGEENMYMNTLGYHSVMMQVIFDVDGNLLSLEQCCPGGTPEHTVWENSDIGRQFSIFQHGHTWVVGSRSLHGCAHVLTPVEAFRIKSNAALRFNKAHSQLHGRTQQVFGSLKSRFQCLRDIGSIQSPESVACTIKACCVLHNICKKFSVPLPLDFSAEPLHPPSEAANVTAEQPFDYMEDAKDEMIEMFFNIAEDEGE
ncbi:putative nuclease HARBI1 isoform X2 [Puntigrus tetrazona]|uniref:putative nuclease HARBI1 isoform X2 n=1 Tax=Puntigrus tetrazona TaxID=1606681 RepID=UPI001C8935B5|nr:putative nuclease HARBI1 isoform X2 [Puntigrus tetrazona]